MSEVQHVPTDEDRLGFDLSPITPGLIKKMLRRLLSGSAPRVDGITYNHLKMMPSTHHFLPTLFSKVFLHSQAHPASWCHAKISLYRRKETHLTKFLSHHPNISDRQIVPLTVGYQAGKLSYSQFDDRQITAKRVPLRCKWMYRTCVCCSVHHC